MYETVGAPYLATGVPEDEDSEGEAEREAGPDTSATIETLALQAASGNQPHAAVLERAHRCVVAGLGAVGETFLLQRQTVRQPVRSLCRTACVVCECVRSSSWGVAMQRVRATLISKLKEVKDAGRAVQVRPAPDVTHSHPHFTNVALPPPHVPQASDVHAAFARITGRVHARDEGDDHSDGRPSQRPRQ